MPRRIAVRKTLAAERAMCAATHRAARVAGAALIAGIASVLACNTPFVDAERPPYDPTALSGIVYHWPVGARIAVHVVDGPTAGDHRLEEGVRIAAERWIDVLRYREHSLVLVDDPAHADIIVRDERVPPPVETGCAGGGWADATATSLFCPLGDTARTLPLVGSGGGRVKLLITIDVVESDQRVAGLEPVILHELGHALGIGGHSGAPTDAMFAVPGVRFPSARDALTLRYVLHRRPDLTL